MFAIVRDDRELFLLGFRIAVQLRRLVCTVLQLSRNMLFITSMYNQSKRRVMSRVVKPGADQATRLN